MTSQEFVSKYHPVALAVQSRLSVPSVAIIAQAALESSWGKKAIGNNIFGIKFRKGDFGSQKVLTTEYSKDRHKFDGKNVKSVKYDNETSLFKFKVWQYFADYESVEDSFYAHASLLRTDRYSESRRYVHSPKRFLISVWRSGYATDPNYGRKMCDMVDSINRRL